MVDRIRQIHLFAAFVLTCFVLMYFISGFVMIFESTFHRGDNSITTHAQVVPGIGTAAGDSLVSILKENLGLRGQYQIRPNPNGVIVTFRRPGTEAEVLIKSSSDSVTTTIKRKNLTAVFHQFHRLHGYHGGSNYKAWAFFYDLSALSMIIFAVTGVYLWYRTERTRWPGWLVLSAFTFLMAYTIYYLGYLN